MSSFESPKNADILHATSLLGLIISILSIGLRFWSRLVSRAPVAWDDWTALAAFPFALAVVGMTFQHKAGMTNMRGTRPTDEELLLFSKGFLYMNIVYDFGITFVKFSCLFFYHRVFGRGIKTFKIALIVTGCLCLLWLIVTIITELFMCSIFQPVWVLDAHAPYVRCLNTYMMMITTSATNVLLDIIILILPHFLLWKLNLGVWHKLGVMGVFVCGYSVVAISLYRMFSTALGDSTMANEGLTVAYVLEIPIAIMSVCLPAIVQLGKRWTGNGFMSLFKTEVPASAERTQQEDIEMQKGFSKLHNRSSFSGK